MCKHMMPYAGRGPPVSVPHVRTRDGITSSFIVSLQFACINHPVAEQYSQV
jgi:hypothetical protein